MARTSWYNFPWHDQGVVFDLGIFKTFVGNYQALLKAVPEVATSQNASLLSRFSTSYNSGGGLSHFIFVPGIAPSTSAAMATPADRIYYGLSATKHTQHGVFDPKSTTGVWISYYDLGIMFGEQTQVVFNQTVEAFKIKRATEKAARKKAIETKRATKLGMTYKAFKAEQEALKSKRKAARMLSKFMIYTSELGKIKSELEQAIKTLGEQRYTLIQSTQVFHAGRRLQSLSTKLKPFATDYKPKKNT